MKLNLSKIIFLFILLFAFDISADKKIPLLEKDLYLKGNKLSLDARSNLYTTYDLIIHIYNDYDDETRDLLQRCEERYQESLERNGKKIADSLMPKVYPECMQDYEKSEVLSDMYAYSTDQNLNRNLFKKLKKCETRYYGDGNEFIEIRDSLCERYYDEKNGSLRFDGVLIQRDNLSTTFQLRGRNEKFEMTFMEREEYEETYLQLDEKHQAYVKEINEKSLL